MTRAPPVPDGALTRQRSGHEPLRCVIVSGGKNSRRRMTRREPVQSKALSVEIDPAPARVPLHEPIAHAKRQPAKLVSPHELRFVSVAEVKDNARNRGVAEQVVLLEI
jgi:hypothetical protein